MASQSAQLEIMKRFLSLPTLLLLGGFLFAESEPKIEPLPVPLSNSAVTSVKVGSRPLVFVVMGMGAGKEWNAVGNSAYGVNTDYGNWSQVRSVPGAVGRLGASAVGVHEQVFLLGGFVADARGQEGAVSNLEIFDPLNKKWYRGPDIPVPVADAVSGVYRDRYIYLVGGWSPTGAERAVQIYDVEKQEWLQGTALPGGPVFGHAGAIVGDTIIYIDGARTNPGGELPRFVTAQDCWTGHIDHKNPTRIEWKKLPEHPGNARFHIAAGGSSQDGMVYFSGGSEGLYNFKGIGNDGKPVEASPLTFAFNLRTGKWESIIENTPNPALDSRYILVTPQRLVTFGGMEKGEVTARVNQVPKPAKKK
jgi:N-acetylneuraminic acid mutarotase